MASQLIHQTITWNEIETELSKQHYKNLYPNSGLWVIAKFDWTLWNLNVKQNQTQKGVDEMVPSAIRSPVANGSLEKAVYRC